MSIGFNRQKIISVLLLYCCVLLFSGCNSNHQTVQKVSDGKITKEENNDVIKEPVYKNKTVSEWIEQLKSDDSEKRFAAEDALYEMEAYALPVLVPALKNENAQVRSSVAIVLGEISDRETIPELLEALKDTDRKVRCAVAVAVSKFDKKIILPIITNRLKNEQDKEIKVLLRFIVAKLGDKSVVAMLIEDLKGKDSKACISASWALFNILDKSDIALLESLLKEQNDWVRITAAVILKNVGDKEHALRAIEIINSVKNTKVRDFILENFVENRKNIDKTK